MPVYYPPPAPFVGGNQPLAPKHAPIPSVVVAADPPPPYKTPTMLAVVLKAWEPGPPMPKLLPPLVQPGIVIIADQPLANKTRYMAAFIPWWWPDPDTNFKLLWTGVLVDDNPPATDNPPFGYRHPDTLVQINWLPVQIPQIRYNDLVQANTTPLDNPPFGNVARRTLEQCIVRAWDPGPPVAVTTAMRQREIPQGFIAVVNDPPFGSTKAEVLMQAIAAWWIPPPAQPTQKPPTQRVNNPSAQSTGRKKRKYWFRSSG